MAKEIVYLRWLANGEVERGFVDPSTALRASFVDFVGFVGFVGFSKIYLLQKRQRRAVAG
jgi:hypothetical protein